PQANGMPELHKLTTVLGALQDAGHRVALLTDGRMSGASGKVPAASHVTPEAAAGGPIAKIRNGDPIRLDAEANLLEALVEAHEWANRTPAPFHSGEAHGLGRELFGLFRRSVGPADAGASIF
ncbi:MAG: dihydroxy-acid dehydratase, partial [Steroidobacteraceae bacterium]